MCAHRANANAKRCHWQISSVVFYEIKAQGKGKHQKKNTRHTRIRIRSLLDIDNTLDIDYSDLPLYLLKLHSSVRNMLYLR